MQKDSKRYKAVGYVDQDEYDELLAILAKGGLTFSGWLRKMIRQALNKKE